MYEGMTSKIRGRSRVFLVTPAAPLLWIYGVTLGVGGEKIDPGREPKREEIQSFPLTYI